MSRVKRTELKIFREELVCTVCGDSMTFKKHHFEEDTYEHECPRCGVLIHKDTAYPRNITIGVDLETME